LAVVESDEEYCGREKMLIDEKRKEETVTLSGEDIGDAGIAYLVDMGSTLHIK
jgi:hypothetical protein